MNFRGEKLFDASFDKFAKTYDDVRPRYPIQLYKDIQRFCDISSQTNLLEIGTGSGIATEEIAKLNPEIITVEPGENLVEVAKQNLSKYRNIQFICDTFENCDFKESQFDIILSATTFHWLEKESKYYDCYKYLKDNGYAAVIHDHRGHGASVKSKEDLGYFYTDNIDYIINDLYDVTKYIKKKYKNKKIYLFSHSMGTLVARGYIQKYDNEIEKLILCGPPTKNELTKFAIKLSKLSNHTNKPNKLLNKLTFGNYSKDKSIDNSWLSKNIDNVNNYNEDELCGLIFTSNGFTNLYKLMDNAFQKENYKMQNKSLPIFLIAGSDDPVIQNENKFLELVDFLKELGYKNVTSKLYKDLKHEILNENEKEIIYKDILKFLNK